MPPQQYLSTDPNAGTPVTGAARPPTSYLSTDPNAGTPSAPPPPVPKPISADEPSTYLGGVAHAWTSGQIGQAELQGLKGFGEGLLESPETFYQGVKTLLTQNPKLTVTQAIDAARRLPAAVAAAGQDPEAWGKAVGQQTGATEIGAALPLAPKAVGAGLRAPAQVAEVVGKIPVGSTTVGNIASKVPLATQLGDLVDELGKAAGREPLDVGPSRTPYGPSPGRMPSKPWLPPPAETVQPPAVASPSGFASMQAVEPAAPVAAPAVAPRPYFLKPDAPWPPAAQTMPTPKGPVNLPESLKPFMKPASFEPTEIEGSGLAARYLKMLTDAGAKASDVIPQILNDKTLTATKRAQAVAALEKVARIQAGVAQ